MDISSAVHVCSASTAMSFFSPVGHAGSYTRHGHTGPSSRSVQDRAQPLAVPSVTLTNPTPSLSPPNTLPPEYVVSSPPKYALIPHSNETALLLGSPPNFAEPGHCPHCLESSSACRRCRRPRGDVDHIVRFLILLNVVVWTMVIWGYIAEWSDGPTCWESYPSDLEGGCMNDPMLPSVAGSTRSFPV